MIENLDPSVNNPSYEIWGMDLFPNSFWEFIEDELFRESFDTLNEALAALPEWQSGGRAAWIRQV